MTLNLHILYDTPYVMFCGISHHFCNLKNVKNTHGGVLLLVKLHAKSLIAFAKTNTSPWIFFHFFKTVQIVPNPAQRITYTIGLTKEHILYKEVVQNYKML